MSGSCIGILLFLSSLGFWDKTQPSTVGPKDLDFEDSIISDHAVSQKWCRGFVQSKAITHGESVLTSDAYHGTHALTITSKNDQDETVSQFFDATPFRGLRVKYDIVAKRISSSGGGVPWLMVENDKYRSAFDKSMFPSVVSREWRHFTILEDIVHINAANPAARS
jgi:hypothetical protein